MKAITIKQPWASLIVAGLKDVENRTWKTNYRGRVLIHAGVSKKEGWNLTANQQMCVAKSNKELSKTKFEDLPFGAILGSVEIVDCVQNHPSVWAEQGMWNWVLKNPKKYDNPIEGVKGKLPLLEYEGGEPEEEKEKELKMEVERSLTAKEWEEKMFRKQISESTKRMTETLTIEEQMRVSFVPLIITQLAWNYAEDAMRCAARDKVSILKKLSRTLKMVHNKYEDELKRDLDYRHVENVRKQTDMCIDELKRDLTILYFSVNQEFKRSTPEYPFDELRTYAIISTLFIDLLSDYNKEVDKLLAKRLHDRNIPPSIVPPLVEHLRTGMVAFAGVEGKFNYNDNNVTMAVKVIENRLKSIEFSIF